MFSQVQRGVSGAGFEQLVSLARSGPKPDLALLCLCTLAHAGSCRPDLGKAGAITVIFEELKKQNYKSGEDYNVGVYLGVQGRQ